MTARWRLALAVTVLAGCELAEVTIPDGDELVVVQALMRSDMDQQWVLVERTLDGSEPQQSTPGEIPQDRPQLPLVGAVVSVSNVSFDADPCGPAVTFSETPAHPGPIATEGLYWALPNCPTMRPGDTLEIRVETPAGDTVSGRTEIVEVRSIALVLGGDTTMLPGDTIEFNRDSDTLAAVVDASVGRAVQVDVRRPRVQGPSEAITSVFVDSTAMQLPGDLPDLFRGGTGDEVFLPGRAYQLTVSFGDLNYFDFLRSFNGPVTGRGFVNHLEGGLGVFGNLVAESNVLRVVGDVDDPREGTYRVQGTVSNTAVDTTWELYLHRSTDSTGFSAFVTGEWVLGDIDVSADGTFIQGAFTAVLEQTGVDPFSNDPVPVQRFTLIGNRSGTGPFQLVVQNALGVVVGTVAATPMGAP